MATLKKYDINAKPLGEVEIKNDLLLDEANSQMIKDYIVAIRANARQWSANTKGRKEVNHSNIKPHPQKGTGRARQGSLSSPQFKGGGVVFGPKPKFDMHVKVNKKEKRKTLRYLFSSKIKDKTVHILAKGQKIEKTKQVAQFMRTLNFSNKRILFLGSVDNKQQNVDLSRCIRNIPKTQFVLMRNVNGYNLALCQEVFLMENAYEEFMKFLTDKKS